MDEKEKVYKLIKNSNKPLKTSDIEKLTGIPRHKIQIIINDLVLEDKIATDRCFNKILGIKKTTNKNPNGND